MRKIGFNNQQYLYKLKQRCLGVFKIYQDNFQAFDKKKLIIFGSQ